MNKIRKIGCITLIFAMFVTMAVPCYAATKKAIKSVSIKVEGKINAGDEVGCEELSVSASGTGYALDHYEILNEAFIWEGGIIPEMTIYLTAKDNYYFNIQKASQISLRGCTYKTAARQNSATTLAVTVMLPAVGLSVGEVELAEVNGKGLCTWTAVENAGSYEIRFMRDSAILGGIQTVSGEPKTKMDLYGEQVEGCTYDGMQYVTKAGTYHFKVRAIHKDDPTIKGNWTESTDVTLTEAEAKAVVAEYDAIQSAGDWINDAGGSRFRLPDGTILSSTWRRMHNEWYYFKPDGYAAKGWTQIDGSWYYFDPETGAMWKNTTTPDGYNLGIDGRRY